MVCTSDRVSVADGNLIRCNQLIFIFVSISVDANGQYSADYMYPGMMDGSNPLNSLMGADPNQFNLQQMNAFMAQYPGLPSLTGGPGYWPAGAGADQSGAQQGMQMFQRMGNGLDNSNNLVFNPNMQYGNLMGPMGKLLKRLNNSS